MRTSIILLLCFVAAVLSQGTYTIIYTGYNDNFCGSVDNSVTGQIFENTCAPEFRQAPRSGKIVSINATTLTSCDYSDTTCGSLILCEDYSNNVCYGSSTVDFSNQYSWVSDGNGGYTIQYSAYTDRNCQNVNAAMTGPIFEKVCAAEFGITPQSGKITFINDDYLTSCDYSDTSCSQLILCENYYNSQCYGSNITAFSNSYSWNRAATQAPTTAPATSAPATSAPTTTPATSGKPDTNEFKILYTAYDDNVCSDVDDKMTGEIFAYTCAPEYRSQGPASGKIVYINEQYLTSCDYSDLECSAQTVCENYNNSVCYSSTDADFSNSYTWSKNADGTFSITYTSFNAKNCAANSVNAAETGPIFSGVCALEYRKTPQSGMITFINGDYLTSCDYSDNNCQNLILCENYNNSQCYASPTVSFSNKYSWVSTKQSSSASSVLSCMVLAVLAIALAL